MFNDIPWEGVSATIIKDGIVDPTTETYIVNDIKTVTYPDAKMVALTLPAGSTLYSGEDVTITLFDFTNPSYATTCTSCPIYYYSIRTDLRREDQYQTGNIDAAISITPGYFRNINMTTDNNFAEGSNAEYTFNF
mmetsp:Transcript_26248/g.4523  ORF Transcript_26248/g.4523 Transcript_26248/m.4523 type:complete len:135 (+) Transcript_26248:199-603(+)